MTQDHLKRIVGVEHLGGHRLRLGFEDGVRGEVDLQDVVRFRGVLKPLEDPAFVAQVELDREFGSVMWPGEVDLDPVILYCAVRGIPVPEFGPAPSRARGPAAKPARGAKPSRTAGGSRTQRKKATRPRRGTRG